MIRPRLLLLVAAAGALLALVGLVSGAAVSDKKAAPDNAIKHVHDPCIIREGDFYYVFSTGPGILVRRSKDLIRWEFLGRVFAEDVPAWAKEEIPTSRGLWAPDIAYFGGRYHLYYSVSTFGKNRSLIGVATNQTLDPAKPDYRWEDEGKVVESFPTNDYNAIDPNVAFDGRDPLALTFGSYWTGIKLVLLDRATGKPVPDAPVRPIARRRAPRRRPSLSSAAGTTTSFCLSTSAAAEQHLQHSGRPVPRGRWAVREPGRDATAGGRRNAALGDAGAVRRPGALRSAPGREALSARKPLLRPGRQRHSHLAGAPSGVG